MTGVGTQRQGGGGAFFKITVNVSSTSPERLVFSLACVASVSARVRRERWDESSNFRAISTGNACYEVYVFPDTHSAFQTIPYSQNE